MTLYLSCLFVAGLTYFALRKKREHVIRIGQLLPFTTTICLYFAIKVLERGLIFSGLKSSRFEIVTSTYPLLIIGFLLCHIAFSGNDKN